MFDVNIERILSFDLLTMTLNTAFIYYEMLGLTGHVMTSVGILPDQSRIYTTSYNSANSKFRIYDIATGALLQTYTTTTRNIFTSASYGGFIYVSSQAGANNVILHKLNVNDDVIGPALIQTDAADMFPNLPSLLLAVSALSDESAGRTSSTSSLSEATLPEINSITDTTYPLNYNNGSFITLYTSEGVKTDLDMRVPCLSDGSSDLTSSMTTYFNGSASPSWVTADSDLSGVTADAPDLGSTDFMSYHIGINFGYSGNTYTQYNELVVHQ